jgi:YhcH/YjgK/YiaL family protein
MNKLSAIALSIVLSALISCSHKSTGGALSSTDVNEWFKKKEYLNGLKAQPHSSVNRAEFARQYKANKALWDAAFAYLKKTNLQTLAKGRYVITPDKLTVSVTEDSTKNFDKTMWESHKKWIDIQYIVRGEEKMGVAPVSEAKVTRAYDATRDVANYQAEGKYYVSTTDRFFIFFPGDAHRPNITTGKNLPDKKIVIKVLAAP